MSQYDSGAAATLCDGTRLRSTLPSPARARAGVDGIRAVAVQEERNAREHVGSHAPPWPTPIASRRRHRRSTRTFQSLAVPGWLPDAVADWAQCR